MSASASATPVGRATRPAPADWSSAAQRPAARVRLQRRRTAPATRDHERRDGEQRDGREHGHHHVMRHDLIEVAGNRHAGEGPRRESHRHESHHERGRREPWLARKRAAHDVRPAELFVRGKTDFRERARHVDPEFVRRRILAGVETLAAVVTEVGQVGEVALRKRLAILHGLKHRTVRLAVAAGVAHGHHVLTVADQVIRQHTPPPPCRQSDRTRSQSSSRRRRRSLCRARCRP